MLLLSKLSSSCKGGKKMENNGNFVIYFTKRNNVNYVHLTRFPKSIIKLLQTIFQKFSEVIL